MIVLLHVAIALISVGYTTYVFFQPSKPRLHVSYTLVVATVLSGFYLVLNNPAHIVQTCVSGLMYIGAVSIGLVLAERKLAAVPKRK